MLFKLSRICIWSASSSIAVVDALEGTVAVVARSDTSGLKPLQLPTLGDQERDAERRTVGSPSHAVRHGSVPTSATGTTAAATVTATMAAAATMTSTVTVTVTSVHHGIPHCRR
jgi:hypothetical protein